MPELMWAVLCQQALVDEETGAISHINTVEEITLGEGEELPGRLPTLTLASVWRRSEPDETLRVRLRFLSPGGVEAVHTLPEVRFEALRHRWNVKLAGLVVDAIGDCSITIEKQTADRWQQAATIIFPVLAPEPAA
jgi:hypothetical protein